MSCGTECINTRKTIRKELSSWSRNVLIAAGLETVAFNSKFGKTWSELCPDSSLFITDSISSDFNVDNYRCTSCELRTRFQNQNVCMSSEESQSAANSRAAVSSPRVDVLGTLASNLMENSTMDTESLTQMMDQSAYQRAVQMDIMNQMHLFCLMNMGPAGPNLPMSAEMQRLVLDNQLPLTPPFMGQQQWLWHQMMLAQMSSQQLQKEQTLLPSGLDFSTTVSTKEETPLDLSKRAMELTSKEKQPNRKKAEEASPTSLPESQNCCSLKRNYTQMDLSAAVNDIRNGKLGTRRASVVYGIPRSTLRNKIYKLEAAEELTGNTVVFKRRRPGGQSSEEKKIADEVEREKSRSTTSKSRSSSISPDSDDSTEGTNDSFGKEDKASNAINFPSSLDVPNGPWSSSLWANIFSGQTSMTPDIMACAKKGSRKKEESNDWKRSRPKRGQYRKYDKNALDEAVQSVRRGEMSVHRAGSFYGVPHSTLEYKVKERNLMRKRKADEAEQVSKDDVQEEESHCSMNIDQVSEVVVV